MHRVDVRTDTVASADALAAEGWDRVVIATGVLPRHPQIEGITHPSVASYPDVLLGRVQAGRRVVILGSGGIGFDVAAMLTHPADAGSFHDTWGVDVTIGARGGLKPEHPGASPRSVVMLQRRSTRPGARLGVSTGWILRTELRKRNVQMIAGCTYRRIDDAGVHVTVDGRDHVIPADTVVVCAGQEVNDALAGALRARGLTLDVIGGAERAEELDALRAIDQGVRLALAC